MIDRISEINRVLIVTKALMNENKIAKAASVIEQCRAIVIEGRMPEHEATIKFSELIGFVGYNSEEISLKQNGEVFLALNPQLTYDLSDNQKNYIIRNCFLDGEFRKKTRECVKCFVLSEHKKEYSWSEIDGTPMQAESWFIEVLIELGFLNRTRSGLEIHLDYIETAVSFIEEPKGWTEEQFKEYLKEKERIGGLAEDLIVAHEASRLYNAGFIAESHCVRKISKQKVNAGYDIVSFDGKSTGMNYDRFIEVKGSVGPTVRFFWTPNEIKVAEELRDKYWIYYQGGINLERKTAKFRPILFHNPYENLFNDDRVTKTPNGYIIEGKITGELIVL